MSYVERTYYGIDGHAYVREYPTPTKHGFSKRPSFATLRECYDADYFQLGGNWMRSLLLERLAYENMLPTTEELQ